MYILDIISKSYSMLSKNEQVRLIFLIVFFIFSALIQVLGVASIAPFMTLLTNPDVIQTNKAFATIYKLLQFTDTKLFIQVVALSSMMMMILSNAISVLSLWLSMRFSISIGNSMQCRLYENLMFRPYLYHKTVNHSRSIATINSQAPRFVYMVLQPFFLLISNAFLGLVILIGLIFLNPIISLVVCVVLGGAYIITYFLTKRLLKKHGDVLTVRNIEVQKILREGFVGIKEVMLNKLHKNFTEKYRNINLKGLNSNAVLTLVGDIPKFVIETIAFSIIFLSAIIALRSDSDSGSIVTILSIFAIAGYKLLPTLQQIFKSISSLSAHGSVAFELSEHLSTKVDIRYDRKSGFAEVVNEVKFENITFKYPSATEVTLKDINVSFYSKMINTIAGHSGSGKTTLADILLGLIPPDSGKILINGKIADSDMITQMQQSCGYVPQHIFILDDTVIENIAFGVDKKHIDEKRIIDVLKKANAWDFVQKLPNGIHTKLGEDGKLLSGGQRQKIGIARCLYRDIKMLILDEPTSALDIESEYDFMMLLRTLKDQLFIVIISHRPSAIKCSDVITLIENGKIEAHGSLSYLEETSPHFRSMLEKSSF